jgi:peptidase M23-like protein
MVTRARIDQPILHGVYSWPLKPFDRAHPVRGYFNDPRISGKSKTFHFGIDIAAANGTPVYAVRAGVVHLEGRRSLSVADGDLDFGYWHVIPAVSHHERVAKHQLLGHVAAPWLHLHFAEHRSGVYRNPLRPGALAPWRDTAKPHVTRILFSRNGRALSPAAISGAVDVVAEAHQMPPVKVPAPWEDLPVTPARIRWRVRRDGRSVRAWHTPVDFGRELLPREAFRRIYAPGTRQNRPGKPGLYRFYLAHTWATTLLEDGRYRLEVEAFDLRGNNSRLHLRFTVANNV